MPLLTGNFPIMYFPFQVLRVPSEGTCYLPGMQPFGPSFLVGSIHSVHFDPFTPGLQTHRPVICSQSSRTDPNWEQPHSGNEE